MQVSKWGNSLGIRLPAAVVEALGLKEGDDIEVVVAEPHMFQVRRKPGKEDMLRRLRMFRGKLPPDFIFDRDALHGRD